MSKAADLALGKIAALKTALIEFTDGDDAIAVADAGVVTLLTTAVAKSEGGAVTHNIAQGLCKAWINFTGITTTAERDSLNVGSLTDVGTGKTNVVYTAAMANVNYSGAYYTTADAGTGDYAFDNQFAGAFGIGSNGRTTSLVKVAAHDGNFIDSVHNDVLIFGDLA